MAMDSILVVARSMEVVKAARPAPEGWLPLSNLDLLIPAVDVGVFFCYRKADVTSASFFMSLLKTSLSEVLATYYPFSGETMHNDLGQPGILCNNRGVDFITTRFDVSLASLQFHDPRDYVMNALVPQIKEGVLCVQATELNCGSVVVACSFKHCLCDAYSANMFLVSWSELARSVPFSVVPSFSRSPLSPSHSGHPHVHCIDRFYVPISQLCPQNRETHAVSGERIYYITASNVARIQASASSRATDKRTKLEAFTAYLWQLISRVWANRCHQLCMSVIVDGRQMMKCSKLETYFGNLLSIPYATAGAEKLPDMELGEVANTVHDCIAQGAMQEHFIGLINSMETHKPDVLVSSIFDVLRSDDSNMAVVVSSGLRFPLPTVDFGWGKPVFASYRLSTIPGIGYVMPLPSTTETGDWMVYAHMTAETLELIEAAAGDVFRPVTAKYLKLNTVTRQTTS